MSSRAPEGSARPLTARLGAWLRGGSGPRVARLFHLLLGLCALAAWISLGVQIDVLIGSHGLLPIAPLVHQLTAQHRAVWTVFPSFLLLDPSDAMLHAGIACGIALAALAVLGVWPRLCFALSAPLYLGYAVAGRDFLSFQWDNLLVECLVLAAFLPRRRASPGAHWMLRLLLFKLYFESGIAKALSPLGDWWNGSAMSYYYETAPLPTWPAWYAHHLPHAWHVLESWGALSLELGVALLVLGPRPARLVALVGLTGFQLLNLATANYGFFVYLALSLHVFLLDDADLGRAGAWLGVSRLRAPAIVGRLAAALRSVRPPARARPVLRGLAGILAALWITGSGVAALVVFGPPGRVVDLAAGWLGAYEPFRVANVYHLFGTVTRERIEPEIETFDGSHWQEHPLRYKPGPLGKAPPFVAPHQPRVDFLLWFHGLRYRAGVPDYLLTLLERLCTDPAAVASLFPAPLDPHPVAVRVAYWQYHFTTRAERTATGDWWRRTPVATTSGLRCRDVPRDDADP